MKGMDKIIRAYGGDILSSDIYKKAFKQKHHHNSSVGRHSLEVAREALNICRWLERIGVEVDEKKAVRAALMHDLGMIGRDDKYSSRYETSRRHPIDSLAVAKEIAPDMDERMAEAIERHMFPVFSKPPVKSEAVAVCIADKLATIKAIIK